jgi:N-ethylmaleimide reductase
MEQVPGLLDPLEVAHLRLRNRIVMAPMTRSRAGEGDVPTAITVEYYRQRAEAGLIITEGTQPSPSGKGYCRTPGIHSPLQVAAWKKVTHAVHQEDGHIFLQIMHVGRIAHPLNKDPDAETVAPSAIPARGQMFTDQQGMVDFVTPRSLTRSEIPTVIEEFRRATENAYEAGFDGVELHCASGYLPVQFLSTGTNRRTDTYGGSVANRIRFPVEVLEAMAQVNGAGRVGVRICPGVVFNDVYDENPVETYGALLNAINPMGLAYLHMIRSPSPYIDAFGLGRRHFDGPLIANDGFDLASGQHAVASGEADLISYGRLFIGNPDLVTRFRQSAPLNGFDRSTLYTPGPRGYTDYPSLASSA